MALTPVSGGDEDAHSDREPRLGTKRARPDPDQMADAVETEPEPLQGSGPPQHAQFRQRHRAEVDRLQQSIQQHAEQCRDAVSQLQQTVLSQFASLISTVRDSMQQSQQGAGQLSTLGDAVNALHHQLEQAEQRQRQMLDGFGATMQALQQTLASLTAAQQQQMEVSADPQQEQPQHMTAHLTQQLRADLAAGLRSLQESVARCSSDQQRSHTEQAMNVDSSEETNPASVASLSADSVQWYDTECLECDQALAGAVSAPLLLARHQRKSHPQGSAGLGVAR